MSEEVNKFDESTMTRICTYYVLIYDEPDSLFYFTSSLLLNVM